MKGVLVASDQTLEWLLPWWWDHYSRHNDYPVAFFDLGLSKQMRSWCEERGNVFHLPALDIPSFEKEAMPPLQRKKWESLFPESLWKRRNAWFRKPFVLSFSPFEETLWIDVDCMIRGPLSPLFSCLEPGVEIAIAKERDEVQEREQEMGFLLSGEICYNSGVIAYSRNAKFLPLWIEKIRKDHLLFITDQHALSRVLFETDLPKLELSSLYNWSMHDGPNEKALIHHYHGALKMEIMKALSHR